MYNIKYILYYVYNILYNIYYIYYELYNFPDAVNVQSIYINTNGYDYYSHTNINTRVVHCCIYTTAVQGVQYHIPRQP